MGPIEHLLVCTDFSEAAALALRAAQQLAVGLDAKVTLLHVLTPLAEAELVDVFHTEELDQDEALEIGKKVHEELQALRTGLFGDVKDVQVEMLTADHVVESILAYAKAHDVQLVVMGSHGRRGLEQLLMGSVADEVARHAHCSVLIARPAV